MLMLLMALLAGAATPDAKRDVGERSSDAASKMVCKRFSKTGSLVGGERICKTKAEWERDRDLLRQQMGGSRSGNCSAAMGC